MTTSDELSAPEAMRRLSQITLDGRRPDELLSAVADIARRTIPGVDRVTVTLLEGDRASSAASTDEVALALDERQYELGHGPCLDSGRGGVELHIADMAAETRWPSYTPRALELGVLSSLSVPLPVQEQAIGALNAYADRRGAFDEPALDLARQFAGFAAIAMHNARSLTRTRELADQMKQAMTMRAVIEQAKGVLMGERRCSPDEAFELLRAAALEAGRPLRDVAQELVDEAIRPPRR